MDHVEPLALDFAKLKSARLPPSEGARRDADRRHERRRRRRSPRRISRSCSTRHGLNLIAERVEDEKTVVQLLDYSVDFAQGYLFGEPRAVREDTVKSPNSWRRNRRNPSCPSSVG